MALATPSSAGCAAGTSRHSTRAVARQHLRDGRADAARRPGHQRRASGERLLPVHRGRRCRPHAHHLPRHVGRTRRQQEAQRGRRRRLRALGHIDQLHRAAAPDLLAERARQPFQRALDDRRLRRRAVLGRPADHHHAPAAADRAYAVVEHGVQRLQPLGRCDARRVEHDAAEAVGRLAFLARGRDEAAGDLPVPVGGAQPFGVAVVEARRHAHPGEQRGQRLAQCPPGAAPTRKGPANSGSPGRWRRSGTGCGRPRLVDSHLPKPERTKSRYLSCIGWWGGIRWHAARSLAGPPARPCGAAGRPAG